METGSAIARRGRPADLAIREEPVSRFIHFAGDLVLSRAASRAAFFAMLLLLSLAILLMLPRTGEAAPETVCFDRAALIAHLNGKFSETPIAAGLAANGSMVEVFSSPEGDTWTIVLTGPDGATCVMTSGESWIGVTLPKNDKIS